MPTDKLPLPDVLRALDTRNTKFFDKLTADEKKSLSPWVLMRFMSSCNTNYDEIRDHYLIMTNEIVNLDFNDLNGHDDLRIRLMQLVGLGTKQYHPWIPPGKRQAKDKITEWLISLYPMCNDDEIEILRSQSDEELKEKAAESGMTDKEIKELFKKPKK